MEARGREERCAEHLQALFTHCLKGAEYLETLHFGAKMVQKLPFLSDKGGSDRVREGWSSYAFNRCGKEGILAGTVFGGAGFAILDRSHQIHVEMQH